MKKFFYLMGLMLCMLFGSMAFVACDDDEEENGGAGDTSISADQIRGSWYGVDENSDTKISVFSIYFESNGTCSLYEYKAKSKNNWQIERETNNMQWLLSNGTIILTVAGQGGENMQMKADLLSLKGNILKIRRYLDEGKTDVIELVRCDTPQYGETILAELLDERSGNGQGGGSGESLDITAENIMGCWYGIDENSDRKINLFVMWLEPDGIGKYAEFKAKADKDWKPEAVNVDINWSLENATVTMEFVTPEGTEYKQGDVLSVTENELTVRRHLEENKTDVMTIKRCNNIDEAGEIFAQTLSKKLGK